MQSIETVERVNGKLAGQSLSVRGKSSYPLVANAAFPSLKGRVEGRWSFRRRWSYTMHDRATSGAMGSSRTIARGKQACRSGSCADASERRPHFHCDFVRTIISFLLNLHICASLSAWKPLVA